MPDITIPGANPAQNNADVAQKLANQDTSLKPTPAVELQKTDSALDILAKEVEAKAEAKAKADATPPAPDEPKAGDAPPAPDAPKVGDAPPAPVENPAQKRAEELFKDSPVLPQNASPKSSEAFSAVKIKAAQEVSRLEATLAEREKKISEMEAKLKNPVPPELEKEIEDLRQFRTRLDIEADPKFKEFDKGIAQTQEFVYAQLRQNPAVTDATIEAIKKHGGPDMVNLDKLFEAIKDPTLKRIVDGAVLDIEKAKFNKAEAIKAAKANVSQYVHERQQEWQKAATHHKDATQGELNKLIPKLEWLKPKSVDDKADENTKKSIAAHNTFVAETNKGIEAAVSDDSPEMRAIMITATAQLMYLQRVHESALAERDALKKQVGELTAKIDAFKASSTTRLRETGAPPGVRAEPAVKPIDPFNTRAVDALDKIRDQVMAERERAKNGQ